jgi:hypothetical protein
MLRYRLDAPGLEAVDENFHPTLAQATAAMRNAVHGAWAWLRENFLPKRQPATPDSNK